MTTGDPKGFRFRESTRAPYKTQVQLRYEKDGEQTSGFSANVSMEGVFVQTNEPRPVGTLVQFEFDLDGQNIQGLGDVVWIRTRPLGAEKPAGMGVQFRYIDPQSRDLVFQIVDQYLKDSKEDEAIPAPGSGMPTGGAIGVPPVGSGSFEIPGQSGEAQPARAPSQPAAQPAPPQPPVSTGQQPVTQMPPQPARQPLPQETVQLDPGQLADLTASTSPASLDLGEPTSASADFGFEPMPEADSASAGFDLVSDSEDFGFASESAVPTDEPPVPQPTHQPPLSSGIGAAAPESQGPPPAFDLGLEDSSVRPLSEPDTVPGEAAASALSNFDINEATAEPAAAAQEQEPPPFFDPEPSYFEQQIAENESPGSRIRRLLPLILFFAIMTTVVWFLKDRILSLVGMGGDEVPEIVEQAPPPQPEEELLESQDSEPALEDPIGELEEYDEGFEDEYENIPEGSDEGDDFLDPEPIDMADDFASDSEPEIQSEPEQIPPPVREQPRTASRPAAAAASPASGGRLDRIATATSGTGTVVTIDPSSNLTESLVSQLRLEAPPRLLVRIRGISQPYDVGGLRAPEFSAVRAGLHNTAERGQEIHLVFDLTSPNVQADWSIEGGNLVLRFRQN